MSAWHSAGFAAEVLSQLHLGVRPRLALAPSEFHRRNYTTLLGDPDATRKEWQRIVSIQKVERVYYRPWVVFPLGLVVKDDWVLGIPKLRIICDATAAGLNDATLHMTTTYDLPAEMLRGCS